jgi:hypothetical protein
VKNVSKRFFSESTWTIETKLPMNDYLKVLYKLWDFYVFIYFPPRGFAGGRIGTRFLHPRGRGK